MDATPSKRMFLPQKVHLVFLSLLPWTPDLENLFRNAHSHAKSINQSLFANAISSKQQQKRNVAACQNRQ